MDNLKWRILYVILVTSLTYTKSQDSWENCTSSSGILSNGNGVTCDFQNDSCGWENDPKNRVHWMRANNSETYYLKLSMSNLTYNQPARVKSRWQCFSDTNMYYLRFKYHLVSPYYCHLRVYVNTTNGEFQLWFLNEERYLYFVQSPNITFNSSNCFFQIIFEGVKTGNSECGFYKEIRIDDIIVTPLPQTSSCEKLMTPVPVTSTSSPSAAISNLMTTHPSSAQSSIFTTVISDSSQSVTSTSRPSAAISPIMTAHPSSAQSSIFTTVISDSSQSGNNSEKEINKEVGTGLTPGAIAGIIVSILIIVIVIIVVITYKRYGKGICDMHVILKQLKRNTKADTTNLNSLKGELHQDKDEQRPVNNARICPGDGELKERKKGYDKPAVPLKPQYYALTHDTGTKGKGPLPASRNCRNGNPDEDYNILHVNPSYAQPRPSHDTYDHMKARADHSQEKHNGQDEYSLARAAFSSDDANTEVKSVGDPVLDDADEYNRLNITNGNYPKGDGHSAAHRVDLYNHITAKVTGTIHQYVADSHDCDYNHISAGQSNVPRNTTVDTYDHVQAIEEPSQTEQVAENGHSSADVSFKPGYVNTRVKVDGIVLSNVD